MQSSANNTYNLTVHNITALKMQQLNSCCIHITLNSDIKHVPCFKPHCMLYCKFGSADSTVLYTDCVLWLSVCITVCNI